MHEPWLDRAGWGEASALPLAGDASARRYDRLIRHDGARAVLMRAPHDGSTARFVAVAEHLHALGFSAPAILAARPDGNALLLEDLGDALFAREVAHDPSREAHLYEEAVDFLAALHAHPAPGDLEAPDAAGLAALTEPAATWYLGQGVAQPAVAEALADTLEPALEIPLQPQRVLAHRDFHAENLVWLDDREGPARVGLLDFQDAFAGPPAYDLVSLLEDARRDLAPDLAARSRARYAEATGADPSALDAACAALGAQRNLRILGVFARLSLAHGKARYVDLIPRVWSHVGRDLAHPDLRALADVVRATLPSPTPELLDQLRQRCGTIPMQ